MIIITGGCGFIGSNLVKQLNLLGRDDILIVDDLSNGKKVLNITDCDIGDYLDKDTFLKRIQQNEFKGEAIDCLFHLGACSDTTEWDGRYVMEVNYEYSKTLLQWSASHAIPFIYASSASVYGNNTVFKEDRKNENPINMYAYSKFLFDQHVRAQLPKIESQVVGLRYFNVYGPRESHKGSMASVAYHFHKQLLHDEKIKLFSGCDGFGNGEQKRDFVYVEDIVKVTSWFMEQPECSGIYNCGTGRSQTFNDVARAAINYHQKGDIIYIPFPDHLKGAYQSFTQADISALRAIGYDAEFLTVEQGVQRYLSQLNE